MLFLVSRRKGCAFEASTLVRLEGICNAAGSGRWMDAPSAPQPEDESLIDTASHYKHPENSAETERRDKDAKKSGLTDEVQVAAARATQLAVQPVHSDYGGLDTQAAAGVVDASFGRIQAI